MPEERGTDVSELHARIIRIRGSRDEPPDLSIIIPVNAKADLKNVSTILREITTYNGKHSVQIVLVINNYPVGSPPAEITRFRKMGISVVETSSARRRGEVVITSARALGVRAAEAEITVHFDVDCRIPDINALLEWTINSFKSGAHVTYSHVAYYDLNKLPSVYAKIAIHNLVRWIKRNFLRIPTTRGSNYAIDRTLFLSLYDAGKLSVDLQVGPWAKLKGAKVIYGKDRSLRVLTSGRRFRGGWLKLLKYFRYRLDYNINVTPTRRRDAAKRWDGFDKETENRAVMDEKR